MRKFIIYIIGIIICIGIVLLYYLQDYNIIRGNYLGKQKEYSRVKIERLSAYEIAREKQKIYGWSEEEVDSCVNFYIDSLNTSLDSGIYIPGLSVFKEKVLDKKK